MTATRTTPASRAEAKANALTAIKTLMKLHDLTVDDVRRAIQPLAHVAGVDLATGEVIDLPVEGD